MQGNSLRALVIVVLFLGVLTFPAYAFTPIPSKSGISGFVRLGGGYIRGKTNMYAGTDFGDIGKKEIDSLDDSPDAKSSGLPDFNFDLRYIFAGTRTQLLAGNRLEDILRYDFVAQVGVRQGIGF